MLYTFNLSHYLSYPFKDERSKKNFLIGSALTLAGFIIPIVPLLYVYGYLARIMKLVMAGQPATMPDWDDWDGFLKDGLRLYGVRLVFTLPIMLLFILLLGLYLGGLFLTVSIDGYEELVFIPILCFVCGMGVIFPFSLVFSALSYPASLHALSVQQFSAGFRFSEWWPILRKNLGGFVLVLVTTYVLSIVLSIGMQVLYFTIICACLLPILMPAYLFYMLLITEPMSAQAYQEGREKAVAAITENNDSPNPQA